MDILNPSFDFKEYYARHSKRSVIIFDYDGTLSPLIKDRMHAYPYPGTIERLQVLMGIDTNRVVIISGRNLKDIKLLLNIKPFPEIWGSHGLEREKNGRYEQTPLPAKYFQGLAKAIEICKIHVPQEFLEVKPFSVAMHWFGTTKDAKFETVEKEWLQLTTQYDFDLLYFYYGIELRARGKTKGDAILQLKKEEPEETAFVYFGDDLTDEDAFAVMNDKDLKVLIKGVHTNTRADAAITAPEELHQMMDQLIEVSHANH